MGKRLAWFWPLVLIVGGVVVLLDNFLLIEVDLRPYWPILLVVLGLQVLVRGDIAPGWGAHTFGITRGSVQSASVEIESGELDVQLHALRKPGRLIAGQYTARSRPALAVRNNHATLRMQRGQTWWLSLADWEVGLAHDLPWDILVSSHLGHLEVDLRDLIIERAYVSSGFGGVNVACPNQSDGTVYARSTLGDVRVTIPPDTPATVVTQTGPLGRVRVDATRFTEVAPGVFTTSPPDRLEAESPTPTDLHVTASTVFGSIYIG